jgi:tyrosyl-tRNA synthetase
MQNGIFSELSWRGLVYQATSPDQIEKWLDEKSRTLYAGFDPTADSLHVGSLMPLMMLRRFQRAGHRPLALVGGATGMIGDPSGKSAERNLLSADQLHANVAGIEKQLRQFLDFSGPAAAQVVNNADWIGKLSVIDFLRDVGKHVSVNVMMAKDSVKSRIENETGISYTEFSYMLLQAYDFVHLNREFGCELQVGGSDQWGNITAGIDLVRRLTGNHLQGMTCPLLTKSDGSKMGKTEQGTVWLCGTRTSPYQFYQYWFNTDDADVGQCLRFLTELSREEIEELDQSRKESPHARDSQRCLAEHLTAMIHGAEGLAKAQQAAGILFGQEIANLNDSELSQIFSDVPSCTTARATFVEAGLPLIDALVLANLSKSKGEARRSIAEGGVYVNNRRAESAEIVLNAEHLASESILVLRKGKKNYALVRLI